MDDNFNDNENFDLDSEVDVNKENEELYNNLIEESRNKHDDYWDRNNPVIKILLLVLLAIGVIGAIYYIVLWLTVK